MTIQKICLFYLDVHFNVKVLQVETVAPLCVFILPESAFLLESLLLSVIDEVIGILDTDCAYMSTMEKYYYGSFAKIYNPDLMYFRKQGETVTVEFK